jgi:hypothetical protein
MIKTNTYNVSFDAEKHIYTLQDGMVLSGITCVLNKYISPDKYDNVPADVLERAKERGSAIHADIACWIDGFGGADTPEVKAFAEWAGGAELYSECLVSDGICYASAIDVVRHLGDKQVHLYDIKTTSVVDEEYCRWQLSIYAYFMHLAGFDVLGASVLHVKDGAIKELPVVLVGSEHVKAMLQAYAGGEDWYNPFVGDDLPEEVANNICALDQTISGLKEQLKYAEGQMEEFKARLLEIMREHDLTAIKTEQVAISIKKAYQRTSIDSKKLKEQYPEIAKECEKVTEVGESLTIKINKK